MTLTREQVIEMAKAAGFPSMSIDNISDTDLGRLERFANLAFSAGRDAGLGEAAPLLQRSIHHIQKWWTRYGEHSPDWLPPAGGVELIEDITALKGKQ